ncbi:hypothetical protein UE94_025135 [Burkholderia cenocepacia]|uniref:hypothetical protein n=1 Tax=Burkholderia cenocepacia TaxID=95486 RepID=UPI001178C81D|nr:hypothetical protein [Burkholderia cenocepacia]MCW3691383.1 hypothetical protein [Burkholderia cenocepacia]
MPIFAVFSDLRAELPMRLVGSVVAVMVGLSAFATKNAAAQVADVPGREMVAGTARKHGGSGDAICDPTGREDSSACLEETMRGLIGGGRVKVTGKYLIERQLVVPSGVSLEGECTTPGTNGSNSIAEYSNSRCGVLNVSPAATIVLSSGASIRAMQIFRAGMTFPAPDSKSYAGTAITIGGDDAAVDRVTILGFERAVYDAGYQRPFINSLYGDNNNGIELTRVYDVARIANCHMWPFATIASSGDPARNRRSGIAYNFHDAVDGPVLVNNFAYGYKTSFRFENVSTVSAVNNFADNVEQSSDSVGWWFGGNLNGFSGVGNVAWSQAVGVRVNLNPSQIVDLSGMRLNHNSTHIYVESGSVKVYGAELFNAKKVLVTQRPESIVMFDRNTLANNVVGISALVSTSNINIGPDNLNLTDGQGRVLSSGDLKIPELISREFLNLPSNGEVFAVKGATGLRYLGGGWAGRTITLIFREALTVYSGDGRDSLFVDNGGRFQANRNAVLVLVHDGVRWIQMAGAGAREAMPRATVATLPACGKSSIGSTYLVTDAAKPQYAKPLTGSGTTTVLAVCDGAKWAAH